MVTRQERILTYLETRPGRTDREITNDLDGRAAGQQAVNQACHQLAKAGRIARTTRDDGRIGNYLSGKSNPQALAIVRPAPSRDANDDPNALQEDAVKAHLESWLQEDGWTTAIAWGKARGVDIEATKESARWLIEVKGCGSRQPMRVNYFIGVLGEMLQRMSDNDARYSIALPDMMQYRRLWQRLPDLAKERTSITVLFVDAGGNVREEA